MSLQSGQACGDPEASEPLSNHALELACLGPVRRGQVTRLSPWGARTTARTPLPGQLPAEGRWSSAVLANPGWHFEPCLLGGDRQAHRGPQSWQQPKPGSSMGVEGKFPLHRRGTRKPWRKSTGRPGARLGSMQPSPQALAGDASSQPCLPSSSGAQEEGPNSLDARWVPGTSRHTVGHPM